jgi:ribonuclease HI
MFFTNILHWNIEGIKPKFANGDIQQLMKELDASCVSFVETKLPFGAKFTIKKFKSYLKNVDVAQGEHARGGVGLFIKSHISSYEINLQTTLQAVAASVKIRGRITLCSLYLPPGEEVTKQELQNLLDQLPKPFIVMGDFNAHHPMWFDTRRMDTRGETIVELIEENDVSLLDRDKMTMIWKVDKTFSHVDLTLCSSELVPMFHWDVNDEPLSSDHFPVLLKSETQYNKGGCPRWIPGKADWGAYKDEMEGGEENPEFHNIQEFAGYFEGLVMEAATKTVPKTKGTGNRKSPPWWSGKCWIAIKKRKAAFRRYRRVASPGNFMCFSKARANVKRVIKASKKESWQKFISGINSKTTSTDAWRKVNMLNNKHRSELVNTIKLNTKQVTISNIPKGCEGLLMKKVEEIGCIQTIYMSEGEENEVSANIRFENEDSNDKVKDLSGTMLGGRELKVDVITDETVEASILDDPKSIADCLGRRFSYISGDMSGDPRFREHRDKVEKDKLDFGTRETLGYNKPFTEQELEHALELSSDSAPGPDEVIYSMLKNLGPNAKQLLLKLFNRIYKEGKLPKQWKEAYIIPILKEGKGATSPGSYRPIALTSCISKVLERMVNRRLVWFLETKGCLPRHQCGFRKGRSTIDSLASLVTEAQDAYRRGEYLFTVFFDLAKAYDTCWKRLIMNELYKFGLRGELPKFIWDYLTDRQFRVRVGQNLSEQFEQKMGVPQGGVLSCTLFSIAINTVIQIIKRFSGITCSIYVDDKRISYATKDVGDGVRKIQRVLDRLLEWSLKTGFKFSVDKTEWMVFHRTAKGPLLGVQFFLDGTLLKRVETKKFLGMILDVQLNWQAHIQYLRGMCLRAMNILSVISAANIGTDAKVLLRIYRALVRSILDYGCQIYGTAPGSYIARLDPVHHKGLRICLGAFRTSPKRSLYVEAYEPKLQYRREMLQLQYYARVKQFLPNQTIVRLDDKSLDLKYSRKSRNPIALGFKVRKLSLEYGISYPNISLIRESELGPWDFLKPTVCMALAEYSKKTTSSEEYQQRFLDHVHNAEVQIYTDGSKSTQGVGAGVVTRHTGQREQIVGRRMHSSASIFSAELYAIKLALQSLKGKRRITCAIYIDSRSAIQAIKCGSRNGLVIDIMELLVVLQKRGVVVELCWIPGHTGIQGNELADEAAKSAVRQRVVRTQEIPVSDVKAYIKKIAYDKWKQEWKNTTVADVKLKEVVPEIVAAPVDLGLVRRDAVKITRLRIGHTRLTHSYHLIREDVPMCVECEVVCSIRHILMECGNLAMLRLGHYDPAEVTLHELLSTREYVLKVMQFLKDAELYSHI